MCRYHGRVLSQYVHIGYITQALYCLLHLHIYIVMEYSETVFFSTVDIKCSGPVILHVNTFSGCYKSATKAIRIIRQYRACVM